MKKRSSQIGESEQEDTQLRKQWAEEFLSQGGFEHILNDFMACSVASDSDSSSKDSSESFELKYLAFMLHLLRTFVMAAFSTSDSDAYQVATLARRSSSIVEGDQREQSPSAPM